ncbi:MAG: L,D-transpeptidase [Caulobacter sp.]|nr:L,D-transpeptidase [Caulobacter sp.]
MARAGAWGALVFGVLFSTAGLPPAALAAGLPVARQASLETENASADARRLTAWVLATGDSQGLPFLVVDKVAARVFAFDGQGRLAGTAAALLGAAAGDALLPGEADRPLSRISTSERITPAGRFVATPGANLAGKNILWIDYAAAISLHPVVVGVPAERRQQRLASPTAQDNRISFGCINVPAAFYDKVVLGLFASTVGIVYILPETRFLETVFFTPAPTSLAAATALPAPGR